MWAVLLLIAVIEPCVGYNNGMGLMPPMGWQTWCSVGPCGEDHCVDGQIREMADTLVSSGMQKLGYNWIILDDCWHPSRAENGSLVPFPRFFPNGMKPVIDYVHSKGLQFGLYTSVGDKTCHGGWSPGSYGHYEQDANTFASWGVDYVKIDYCGQHDSPEGQMNMSRALNATGRPIGYMLCRGPYQEQEKWGYAPEYAQGWRATGDHHDEFSSLVEQVNSVKGKSTWSGPYGWAYLDMMMTGGQGCADQCTGTDDKAHCNFTVPKHCPGQTDDEYRTEASLYAVVSSPMMIGTDLRLMTPIMKELLFNEEVIAINQDYKATPGDAEPGCSASTAVVGSTCSITLESQLSHSTCTEGISFGCVNGTDKMWIDQGCRGVFTCDGVEEVTCSVDGAGRHECPCKAEATEVWVRRLSDGDFAIALTNFGPVETELSFCLDTLKWPHGSTALARDVWAKKELGSTGNKFSAKVRSHDTLLVRIRSA